MFAGVDAANGRRSSAARIRHGKRVGETLRGRRHRSADSAVQHAEGLEADRDRGRRRTRDHELVKVQPQLADVLAATANLDLATAGFGSR